MPKSDLPKNPQSWSTLKSLRELFLEGSDTDHSSSRQDYWTHTEVLEQYDRFFGKRIQWKWESVLNELSELKFTWGTRHLVDWGCGTGRASRTTLEVSPSGQFDQVFLYDRSASAVAYSKTVLENAGISVRSIDSPPLEPYSLLVSHVLNEVSDLQSDLLPWIEKSQNAVWLEPGTPWHSHRLIELRERLRDRFYVWAPCSHSTACGLVKNEKSKDWCHHFADVPSECFQSKEWADFSKELKIDLRSLPVSYLVLSRTPRNLKEFPRVIGRPRKYSGFLKALVCNEDGVIERTATRGKDPKNYKALSKEGFVKHWE